MCVCVCESVGYQQFVIDAFGAYILNNTHTKKKKKKRRGRGVAFMGDNITACNLAIHCIFGILCTALVEEAISCIWI